MVGSLPSSSVVSLQRPPNSAFQKVPAMGVAWSSSDYTPVSSAAGLNEYIYRERPKWCMPYYDVANLVTVTKMNMRRQNTFWLCKNHCCETTASHLLQSWAAVLATLEVSDRAAHPSQLLLMSPAVMPLVLQVYFRDHKGSLDNPNMDTQSELMKYH